MESPLPDEEMHADGDFKNVEVRKKKESPPLNSSIQRTFATETPSCEASKIQRDITNFNNLLMNKQQQEMKYNDGEEWTHNCYGHQAFRDSSNINSK